jgi:hypothetical protein
MMMMMHLEDEDLIEAIGSWVCSEVWPQAPLVLTVWLH